MTKRIRKQCYDLTLADFESFPYWEFALDEEGSRGQDEATVRPAKPPRSLKSISDPLITAAVFCFPNGRVRLGHLTLSEDQDLSDCQPGLVIKGGHLLFYLGAHPDKRTLAKDRKRLEQICRPAFPIRFHTVAHDKQGRPFYSGTLQGFYQYGGYGKKARLIKR